MKQIQNNEHTLPFSFARYRCEKFNLANKPHGLPEQINKRSITK